MTKRQLDYEHIGEFRRKELEYHCLQYDEFFHEGRTDLTETIEQAAIATSPALYPYILKHIKHKDASIRYTSPPCGDRQFYDLLRRFYKILSDLIYPQIKKGQ